MLLLASLAWPFSVSVAWDGVAPRLTRRLDEGVQRCAKGPVTFRDGGDAGGAGRRCGGRARPADDYAAGRDCVIAGARCSSSYDGEISR